MPWNGPIENNYDNCDFTQPPWTNGIAALTHEEVMYVIDNLPDIEAEFLPDTNMVISRFNWLSEYEKPINGDTYNCIKGYDPEIHTLGINESGIVIEGDSVGDTSDSE